MKTPFKIGERVAAYNQSGRIVGIVREVLPSGNIILGYNLGQWEQHHKQCRRLKPRAKRRELYISDEWLSKLGAAPDTFVKGATLWKAKPNVDSCLFREVRAPKKAALEDSSI